MLKRALEKKLLDLAKQFPIVALLGPRQSGKTTLAKMAFPTYRYLSLEDPDTRDFALNDPRGFLATLQNYPGIILDEMQKAPPLFSYLQTLVDTHQEKGRFIITGSQNFLLNEKISQSLAGRVALLTLLPLSIGELKNAKLLPDDYESLLFQGGYPRTYVDGISPQDWYPNYIHTYVERDIRELVRISDLYLFQRFVHLCAGRIGGLINFSDLGRDCGISYNTAKSWLSLLQASYILFFLPPYFQNFNKRLVKAPKLYFYDTGLACSLLGIESKEQLETHYLKGGLFESFVVSELMKGRLNHGRTPNLYFWRDKMGHEIDCLIEQGGNITTCEIKAGRTIASDFFQNLAYWQHLTNTTSAQSYLIYGGSEEERRSIAHVLGWQQLMALLEVEK